MPRAMTDRREQLLKAAARVRPKGEKFFSPEAMTVDTALGFLVFAKKQLLNQRAQEESAAVDNIIKNLRNGNITASEAFQMVSDYDYLFKFPCE